MYSEMYRYVAHTFLRIQDAYTGRYHGRYLSMYSSYVLIDLNRAILWLRVNQD